MLKFFVEFLFVCDKGKKESPIVILEVNCFKNYGLFKGYAIRILSCAFSAPMLIVFFGISALLDCDNMSGVTIY